jgi:NTE family protein
MRLSDEATRQEAEANNSAGLPPSNRLFVAFEGGGAKALVHVGALKAIEERGFEFKGVAGTSAGAIVAALKAVGYTADEIVDPIAQRTILDSYNDGSRRRAGATDILGLSAWSAIKRVRFLAEQSNRRVLLLCYAGVLAAFFLSVSWLRVSGMGSSLQDASTWQPRLFSSSFYRCLFARRAWQAYGISEMP